MWTANTTTDPVQWGKRLDENGAAIGASFQISQIAESGRGSLPQVAYNQAADEYLVAWYSFKSGEDGEAWGQRINGSTGAAIGGDVPLTAHGTTTDDNGGGFPSIAYNPLAGNYLMTFTRDDDNPNPDVLEVYSQVLSATAVPQGTPKRLSTVGKLAYEPATAYAKAPGGGAGQYLVVWQQDSPPPGFADYEMWGQRVQHDGALLGPGVQDLRGQRGVQCRPVGRGADRRDRVALGVVVGLPAWRRHPGSGHPDPGSPRRHRRGDGGRRLQACPGTEPDPDPDPTPTPAPGGSSPTGTQPPATVPPPVAPKPAPALKSAEVLRLPSTKRCVSRRRFRIRLRTPRGAKLAKVTVRVNGKLVRTVRGKRITAQVDLRGLPRGRFRVKIEVRTVDGRKVSATRRYRTCAPKRR